MARERFKRWPPIIGAVGFDYGTKPAIALVIPKKKVPSKIPEIPGAICNVDVQCWNYDVFNEKCGFGFADCGDPPKRYAVCEVKQQGLRTVVHDDPPLGETSDCPDTTSKIGDGTPIVFTYNATPRFASDPGDCLTDCIVADDYGYDDDTGQVFEGTLVDGCAGNPVLDPNGLGLLPRINNFHQPVEPPDPDIIFDVITYDEDAGATVVEWTLDEDNCPDHRKWSWNETVNHSNGDDPDFSHDCFSDPSETPIDWTTTVTNSYEVTLSDEILTSELIADAIAVLATDSTFTSTLAGLDCRACFLVTPNELEVFYRSVFVRLTNSNTRKIRLEWDVATWAESGDPDSPCTATGDPALDHDTVDLDPGASHDIQVYPDSSGPNVVMGVVNLTCRFL